MSGVEIKKGISNKVTVTFPYNLEYIEKVKAIKGYRWHPEEKYWSFPNTDVTIGRILEVFKDEKIQIDPALQIQQPFIPVSGKIVPSRSEGTQATKQSFHTFEDLRRELLSRKYSHKTVKVYLYYNRDLLNFIGKVPPAINDNDIRITFFILPRIKSHQLLHCIRLSMP